jgi:hypothetical protein
LDVTCDYFQILNFGTARVIFSPRNLITSEVSIIDGWISDGRVLLLHAVPKLAERHFAKHRLIERSFDPNALFDRTPLDQKFN